VQLSCAVRVNYAGVKTKYIRSMSSYFVGIMIWAVSDYVVLMFCKFSSKLSTANWCKHHVKAWVLLV